VGREDESGVDGATIVVERGAKTLGETDHGASATQRGRAAGEGRVFERWMLELESGEERNERGVGEVHDHELARGEEPSAVAGRHRFLGGSLGFWGCAKTSK
jgi:hypothetical protein